MKVTLPTRGLHQVALKERLARGATLCWSYARRVQRRAVLRCREPSKFRGTQGTAVVGVFDMTCASTGANERTLKREKIPFEKVYVHVNNHAGYYPGAGQVDMKLLFDPKVRLQHWLPASARRAGGAVCVKSSTAGACRIMMHLTPVPAGRQNIGLPGHRASGGGGEAGGRGGHVHAGADALMTPHHLTPKGGVQVPPILCPACSLLASKQQGLSCMCLCCTPLSRMYLCCTPVVWCTPLVM